MKIVSRNNKYRGLLIAVEGIDGCGKTTATLELKTLIQKLLPQQELVSFRAPGSTEIGEKVRNILLHEYMAPTTELLLFMASHNECIERVIVPALERGAIVLTDRFLDSTYAYQGYGRGLLSKVRGIHHHALNGFEPDHVIYVCAEQQIANDRVSQRGDANRLDNLEAEIKRKIRQGMMDRQELRLRNDPDRVTVIQNDGDIEHLVQQCHNFVQKNLI